MAALIMVREGRDWQSSGALFDWTLRYLIPRVTDEKTTRWLQAVVEENLGNLWIPDLPPEAQQEIYTVLQAGLIGAAQRELPDPAVAQLRELVALTFAG